MTSCPSWSSHERSVGLKELGYGGWAAGCQAVLSVLGPSWGGGFLSLLHVGKGVFSSPGQGRGQSYVTVRVSELGRDHGLFFLPGDRHTDIDIGPSWVIPLAFYLLFPFWFLASLPLPPPICFKPLSLLDKPLPSAFSPGLTNVLGSLVSSYPVTGSFGR